MNNTSAKINAANNKPK